MTKLKVSAIILLTVLSVTLSCAKSGINETRGLSGNGKIYIDNISGSITVSGWDKNEISIKGNYRNGVDRIDIDSSSNSIRITVVHKFGWIFGDGRCDLDIIAPLKSNLNISTVNAKIDVNGLSGQASVESVNGKMTLSGNLSSLEVRNTNGDIVIDGNNENIEVKTTSGDVEINGSGSDMDVTSISGDVKVEGKFLRVKIKTISGDIESEGKDMDFGDFHSTSGGIFIECIPRDKADIGAETTSGKIEMNVPKELSAKLRLESFSGRIKIDGINYNKESDEDESDAIEISKSIRITIGKGESKIYLQSLSGSIFLNGK
jgi:DUF4097 and DUF4098 domain-containing protein YvlB